MLNIVLLLFLTVFLFALERKRKQKSWLQYVILGLFNWLVVECVLYFYFLFLISQGSSFFLIGHQHLLDRLIKNNILETLSIDERNPYSVFRLDPQLGYAPGQNKMTYQFKSLNGQGLRSDREYRLMPPRDHLRLAAFGDSFVFCDDEITQNCWTHFLEKSVHNLEVLNFGVSGYGLGQSYLRYLKDGLKFKPDIIFINYVSVTDRDKVASQTIARGRSLRSADAYRVRFWIEKGELMSKSMSPMDLFDKNFRQKNIYAPLGIAVNDPFLNKNIFSFSNIGLFVKQLIAQKRFANIKMLKGEKEEEEIINFKILEDLLNVAAENGTEVIFFVGEELDDLPRSIQALLKQHTSHMVYVNSKNLLNLYFHQLGVERKDLLNQTGHYNPKGNMIYARAVGSILETHTWGPENKKFKFDQTQKAFIPFR